MKFYNPHIDKNKYVIAKYFIGTKSNSDISKAAWDLAIGQSVGNPNVRNNWETEELFERSSCVIMHEKDEIKGLTEGEIKIAFPIINTDWHGDGISHLLCQVMGGQMDIEIFETCRLLQLEFPSTVKKYFLGPKYGITGMRDFTKQFNKPFSGAIVKPKTGISPSTLLEMVKELVEGGCDFIKEDDGLYVGLFHGPIQGLSTDLGFEFDNAYSPLNFVNLDIVLCGDIHKRQMFDLSSGGRAFMIGSLIQQNFGETVNFHGYGIYDVESEEYTTHDIDNEQPFLNFSITDISDIENNAEILLNIR